jgi:hypothetical protein
MHRPNYSIEVDTERDLLTIRPTGLWDMAVLTAHCADFERAVASYQGRPYRILADLRGFAIQPQNVHAALQAFVAQQDSVRTAMLLSGSVLQRMQSQRITAGHDAVLGFGPDEEVAARLWLLEAEMPASPRVARG